MARPLDSLRNVVRRVPGGRRALRLVHTIRQVPDAAWRGSVVWDSSPLPVEQRKSRFAVVADHIRWSLAHGEIHDRYLEYGLDRPGSQPEDFLAYEDFKRVRDNRNMRIRGTSSFNYVCLVRDKFVFGQVAQSLGYPVPRTLALLEPENVDWLEPRHQVAYADLPGVEPFEGFCKPIDGFKGEGVRHVEVRDGALLVDGAPVPAENLRPTPSGRSMLQERVIQHSEMARLHPPSVNTLRLVTVLDGTAARLFMAFLRIGARGSRVDNYNNGTGLMVSVDERTGRLAPLAFTGDPSALWTPSHPDTGVVFDGFDVPLFQEAVELVRQMHRDIRHIHTLGWDVAVGTNSPVVIEANDNWGAKNAMALQGGFKDRFLQLYA